MLYIVLLTLLCACSGFVPKEYAFRKHEPMKSDGFHPRVHLHRPVKETESGGDDWNEEDDHVSQGLAPETVLSVHYDRGMVKELYLSQSQKELTPAQGWIPSVQERKLICEDLCEARLGGEPCGLSCRTALPSIPRQREDRSASTSGPIHQVLPENASVTATPRSDVCQELCNNGLGQPLCGCQTTSSPKISSWQSICDKFCLSKGPYQLKGCPSCKKTTYPSVLARSVNDDIWIQYCKEKCKAADGGAACNCDLIPFTM